jgi:hypothetical protein
MTSASAARPVPDFFAGLRARVSETGSRVVVDWSVRKMPSRGFGHVLFLCPADRTRRSGATVEVATVFQDLLPQIAYWDVYARLLSDPLLCLSPVSLP